MTVVGVFIALLSLGSFVLRPAQANDATTVTVLKRVEAKSRAVASRVLGATVGVINLSLAGNGRLGEGSGVVVSEDGLVLTVGHVIAQPGCELTVVFPDGRRAAAKALGANFARDSGLAKITEPGKWPHVEMGHSDDIRPGAWCMALGHPGGIQQGRTPPIRLGRVLNSGKDAKFLVTDATIISGDSGGPLFDLDGRVIGIHSNIGRHVDQNQHVPIDAFREQWTDLLAGKAIGSPADLHTRNRPNPEKLKRFHELLLQRLLAGDAEVRDLMKGGRLELAPGDLDRLIAKWEKAPSAGNVPPPPAGSAAAASAAARPLDFLKFQRLFQDRLLAGDPEVLRLITNGTMMVTPEQMHQLMEQWEKKTLAADSSAPKAAEKPAEKAAPKPAAASNQVQSPRTAPSPSADGGGKDPADQLAKLRELMKNAQPLGSGRYQLRVAPEDAKGLEGLLAALQGSGLGSTTVDYGKSSPTLLHDVAPIAARAGRSTVVVVCDGKPAAWGTVVRKDGYIVTKASEVHGKLACRIGSHDLPATVVKSKTEYDLALLKVDANNLVPIAWAEGGPPLPGSWLITPAPEKEAIGLGIVSGPARAVPNAPKILLQNRAVIGVILDLTAKDARVHVVTPNLPAAKAGLKPGDVILNIDGRPTPRLEVVNQIMGKYKPGDKLAIEIRRDGKPLKLKVDLVSSDRMAPSMNEDQLNHLSQSGGTISKRHNDFASAITHDTVLQAAQCGGPVVDLDGRAIGLNIARADRTASYAIPSATVRKLVAELLAGVK
jgi:serine protease Do